MFWWPGNESWNAALPVKRCMGGAQEVGEATSCAPLSPPLSLIFLHSPSLFPPFLPLSSALAQDCINILLKPVSTAARSPSLPPSLLRWLFLFPPFLTVAFRFFSVSLFCWRDRFPHNFYQPVQKGEAVLLSSVRSSPCCTHAHSHTCVHTHTYWGGGYRCLWQSMLIGSEWLLPLVGEWNGYF